MSILSKVCILHSYRFNLRRLLTLHVTIAGNEDDHIVISVVRTERVGFLQNERRLNVMLSRFKRSMIICTNMYYIQEKASKTLLGKLAREWMAAGENWLSWQDLHASQF